MTEQGVCPLCGAGQSALLFETRDHLLKLPGAYRFVRCLACGLNYVASPPSWTVRAPHYDLAEYRGYHDLDQELTTLRKRLAAYGLRKRQKIVETYKTAGRLLDVGCGTGDFLVWMGRRKGWQVIGVERNPAVARMARRRYGLPVINADLQAAGLAGGSFDVVTLWTVLEHLPDPQQALVESARLLRQGGLLIVRTLSQEAWGARWFGPNWLGYDAPRVLVVFPRNLLVETIEQAGLLVERLWSPFHDYYPFLWSWQNFCEAWPGSAGLCRAILRLVRSWPSSGS